MTIAEAIQFGIKKLSHPESIISDEKSTNSSTKQFVLSPTPSLDVNCILENILQKNRTYLLVHRDEKLNTEQESKFINDLQLRTTGLPIAYITGHKEFFGIDFYVSKDTLIPKPDTELLVEHALEESSNKIAHFVAQNKTFKIADICTGSGCIALSVAHKLLEENPNYKDNLSVTATDISNKALKIAKKNTKALNLESCVDFFQGDLLNTIPEKITFNLILSNPPYIPSNEVTQLLTDGRSEPRLALDGDIDTAQNQNPQSSDGLAIIRRLIPQVFERLENCGLFLIETGEYNAKKTACLMEEAGFTDVKTFTDLAGQLRLTQGRKA